MSARTDHRTAIVEAAARLLQEQGRTAVTTRAVAEAAGVQAPTLYRLFGDKDGLLDAVAEHVMATYVAAKAATADVASTDPVAALRSGWHQHVDFGLANPELYAMLNDPARAGRSPATQAGVEVLSGKVRRVAEVGRLAVPERRAVEMMHAAGAGAVLTLLSTPAEDRDPGLADALWGAVAAAIVTDAPPAAGTAGTAGAADTVGDTTVAVTFATVVDRLPGLSEAERTLLGEWLDRATRAGG